MAFDGELSSGATAVRDLIVRYWLRRGPRLSLGRAEDPHHVDGAARRAGMMQARAATALNVTVITSITHGSEGVIP